MHLSQRAKLAMFDDLQRENDLLGLYLHDTQVGENFSAVETHSDKVNGKIRIQLFRATGASGGYVVIKHDRNTRIQYLDVISNNIAVNPYSECEPIRILITRLVVKRNSITRECQWMSKA